jgi:hypothetical protein
MGRFVTYVLVLAVVLPVVATAKTVEPGGAAGASTPTAPPAGGTPALRALRLAPLTVQGLHFTAKERVVLTVFSTDGVARKKTTTAAPNGSFTISFGNEQGSRCDTLVHAVGSRGNRARLKLLPRPACLTV